MKKGLSDKLTIVVPTYNRYPRLLRLLEYAHSLDVKYHIYVLDSSSDSIGGGKLQKLLSNGNIKYTKFDSTTPPHAKMYKGTQEIQTPYTVLWADDDLMIPHSFEHGVDFLEENKDFSMVHGRAGLFSVNTVSGKNVMNCGDYHQRSYIDETASKRLVNYLDNYSTTFYSIQRTNNFKNNIGLCCKYEFGYFFGEIALSCLSIIQGKAFKMKHLYMVREAHDEMDSLNTTGRKIDAFDLVTGDIHCEKYPEFNKCLSNELVKEEKISFDEAQEVVKQAYWAYLSKGLMHKYRNRYGQGNVHTRIKKGLKRVPIVADYLLPVWRAIRSKMFRLDEMSLPALLNHSSPYHADFMPVYRAITMPPKGE